MNATHIPICNSRCIYIILSSLPLSSVFIYQLSHTCLFRLIARQLIPLIIFGLRPPLSVVQPIKASSNFTSLTSCSPRSHRPWCPFLFFLSVYFRQLSAQMYPSVLSVFLSFHFPLLSNIVVLNGG